MKYLFIASLFLIITSCDYILFNPSCNDEALLKEVKLLVIQGYKNEILRSESFEFLKSLLVLESFGVKANDGSDAILHLSNIQDYKTLKSLQLKFKGTKVEGSIDKMIKTVDSFIDNNAFSFRNTRKDRMDREISKCTCKADLYYKDTSKGELTYSIQQMEGGKAYVKIEPN